jgi:hypothetical protein
MKNSRVSALKGTSQNIGFTKDKCAIYNGVKIRFCAARSAQVRSIALSTLERTYFFNIPTVQVSKRWC